MRMKPCGTKSATIRSGCDFIRHPCMRSGLTQAATAVGANKQSEFRSYRDVRPPAEWQVARAANLIFQYHGFYDDRA